MPLPKADMCMVSTYNPNKPDQSCHNKADVRVFWSPRESVEVGIGYYTDECNQHFYSWDRGHPSIKEVQAVSPMGVSYTQFEWMRLR